jgi:hypothetical protein
MPREWRGRPLDQGDDGALECGILPGEPNRSQYECGGGDSTRGDETVRSLVSIREQTARKTSVGCSLCSKNRKAKEVGAKERDDQRNEDESVGACVCGACLKCAFIKERE